MKTGAAVQAVEPRGGLTVLRTDQTEPLSECVRKAMRFYLRHLGEYEARGLYQMVIAEVERPLIETLLEHTQGNQTQAARMLGVSRSTLRKKMAHYGIGGAE